jgi:hypothetical protein
MAMLWKCRAPYDFYVLGCDRNLKSGIQYELCERWYHHSCRRVKTIAAERENCNWEMCRSANVRRLKRNCKTHCDERLQTGSSKTNYCWWELGRGIQYMQNKS